MGKAGILGYQSIINFNRMKRKDDVMSIQSIYVNLPIKDVAKTRAFWTALGFPINEQFSDEKAICLVLKEEQIYAMLIAEDYFKTFTHKPIADGTTTQVLLAIDVGSKDRVDDIIFTAIKEGGKHYLEAVDMGWMYYDRFEDIDDHQWEVMTTMAAEVPTDV